MWRSWLRPRVDARRPACRLLFGTLDRDGGWGFGSVLGGEAEAVDCVRAKSFGGFQALDSHKMK